MRKKVLIIGVNGFVGKVLYNSLQADYRVHGISENEISFANCYRVNLLKHQEVQDFFSNKNFDVIINLASILAKQSNLNNFDIFYKNNLMIINLIKAIQNKSNYHIINFSSSSVYPNTTGTYNEKAEINPSQNNDCLYGLSKFNAEMLINYFLKEKALITNMRIGMIYGAGMNKTRIHSVFLNQLKKENKITIWGNGLRVIPHISINNLSIIIKQIIKNNILGTFNIADENISIKQLAGKFINEFGNENSQIELIEKGNQNMFYLDCNKFHTLINA